MATWYLMNNIRVATTFHFAGEFLDDSKENTSLITGAGGQLWPSSDAAIAAAAANAQSVKLRGGSPEECSQIMLGGMAASVLGAETNRYKARGVVFANVAALATFTVAANDGITYVAGDQVLLTAQTSAAQNGPYVVGTVAGGTAALTRPSWWSTKSAIQQGVVIDVGGEGTIFGGSQWKALCATGKIVDTDDPVFYPRTVRGTATLVAGTVTLGSAQGLFLKSTTTSSVEISRNTANTTAATIAYAAAAGSRTAGVSGTAAVTIQAQVAAGTINNADISTLDFAITNW